MPIISVTRLRLRSYRYLPLFLFYSILSAWQAKRTPGNLGVTLLVDEKNTYWTRTAWIDEVSMRTFAIGSVHRHVMPKLSDWASEASAVHWEEQEFFGLPSWDEAHQKMIEEGFRGKLNYPSPAHISYEIATPKVLIEIFS